MNSYSKLKLSIHPVVPPVDEKEERRGRKEEERKGKIGGEGRNR